MVRLSGGDVLIMLKEERRRQQDMEEGAHQEGWTSLQGKDWQRQI